LVFPPVGGDTGGGWGLGGQAAAAGFFFQIAEAGRRGAFHGKFVEREGRETGGGNQPRDWRGASFPPGPGFPWGERGTVVWKAHASTEGGGRARERFFELSAGFGLWRDAFSHVTETSSMGGGTAGGGRKAGDRGEPCFLQRDGNEARLRKQGPVGQGRPASEGQDVGQFSSRAGER